MIATTKSRATLELATESGTNGSTKPGSGSEPMTLSTAILSGTGVSSRSGVASRSMNRSRRICRQKGAIWRRIRRDRRRFSERSLKTPPT